MQLVTHQNSLVIKEKGTTHNPVFFISVPPCIKLLNHELMLETLSQYLLIARYFGGYMYAYKSILQLLILASQILL